MQIALAARLFSIGIAVAVAGAGVQHASAEIPGEVGDLRWCAGQKNCLQWSAVAGATSYNVYRGASPSLACVVNPAFDSCDHGPVSSTTTGSTVNEVPAAGGIYWFLVTAADADGEGPYGFATTGPRESEHGGSCSGSCLPGGAACAASRDCCSASCIGGTCRAACCVPAAGTCTQNADCCSGTCGGGVCQAACTPTAGTCSSGSQCCSGTCAGSACQCTPIGNACTTNAQCCAGTCSGGVCRTYCGDGFVGGSESCDDHNATDGDGCSSACTVETPYTCSGSPSVCTPCPAGQANCNSSSSDGCEVTTSTDPFNCGECGNVCSGAPNAVGTCAGGGCGVACASGFANCDGGAANGCECAGNICCGTACEPAHVNGLGQSFDDCAPLGVPGNSSTYSKTLAVEARAAWPFFGTDADCSCTGGASCVYRQTATSCAVWMYTKGAAGYVHLNSANNTCVCATTADAQWR